MKGEIITSAQYTLSTTIFARVLWYSISVYKLQSVSGKYMSPASGAIDGYVKHTTPDNTLHAPQIPAEYSVTVARPNCIF